MRALPVPKKEKIKRISAVERRKNEAELLQLEWAFKYANYPPKTYLRNIKGYSVVESEHVLKALPAAEWYARKEKIGDEITADLIKRHTDIIAEVQEQHIRASNIGLAKAIEMISRLEVKPAVDSSGELIKDKYGHPVFKGFRSIDLLNAMNSIKIAQEIYRKAMGLPNDGEGLAQILEKLGPTTNNTQININAAPQSEKEKALNELSYDEIMTFVEHKRELMAKEGGDESGDS